MTSGKDVAGANRLAIGTVQFGIPYGVANTRGQVPPDEVATILAEARAAGCDTLDTAMSYGEAERVIGEAGAKGWRIITKLPPLPSGERDIAGWAWRCLEQSLCRLGVSAVYGLLVHRPHDVFGPNGTALLEVLARARAEGLAAHAGVSISSPADLTDLMRVFDFSLVQAPFNEFDRRLLTSGWMEALKTRGVELHVRSVFLQGLLLMSPESRPAVFARWAPLFDARDRWVQDAGMTSLHAAIGDALAQPNISRVVVGVDSVAQWREVRDAVLRGATCSAPPTLASSDEELINPAKWPVHP